MKLILFLSIIAACFITYTNALNTHEGYAELATMEKSYPKGAVNVVPNALLEQKNIQAVKCNETRKLKLIVVVLAVFVGTLGADRYYTGFTALGVLKLLITIFSCGLCGWIWWLIDLLLVVTGAWNTDSDGCTFSTFLIG
eukprot:gene11873-5200_t